MNNNDNDPDSRARKPVLSKKSTRNHSPYLKERVNDNSGEPIQRTLLKKNSLNAQNNSNNNRMISEKIPTKNIAIRFNKKKTSTSSNDLNELRGNENAEKNRQQEHEEIVMERQQERINNILDKMDKMEKKENETIAQKEKPELKKEVKTTENETENVKRSLEQEAFMRDSAEKPSNLIAAANVRGMFMNEHISKEEYLKSQDKKRKMKEILEDQMREKARKKEEEKRKEMELNKIEEQRIKKELDDMENKFKIENPYTNKKQPKQNSNDNNGLNPNSQIKTSLEIETEKNLFREKETKKEKERENEKGSINTINVPVTPNEKRPDSNVQGIFSPEEAEYLKKIIEDNSKLKDDKSKLQDEVDKKEEIINLLINVWNNNNNPNSAVQNGPKPPSAQKNVATPVALQPQIRRNKIPELKRPTVPALSVHREDRILIEEKLRMIDNKIINARQKSLLLKNEKVHKLKEDYLKKVDDLNTKKSPYKIYDAPTGYPQSKNAYRQFNSVPPKTTDNSYQRVTSMQEINDEEGLDIRAEKPNRILKTSTPYKTNLQMQGQIKDQLNEDYRDFGDINSFKMIGNYLTTSSELKEKKPLQLNLKKNLENLKFENAHSDFLERKLPLFPNIKSSVELKSRSEFMRLDLPLNNNPFNKNEEQNFSDKFHVGFQDFRMTPHESKRMVLPSPHDYEHENEFHGMDLELIHIKSPSMEVKMDNEILVVDHNSNRGLRYMGEEKNSNNEIFNPYTTNTSINTINTTAISKNKFPRDVFRPTLKKKGII